MPSTGETTQGGRSAPTLRQALSGYVQSRSRALDEARRTLNIGEGDARAMLHIADNPGIRPTQLREYLNITSAGVTALIDRLEDRDVVRRDVDPLDRRVSRITLTIDLEKDPWVSLTRFDTRFDEAVTTMDAADMGRFADSLVVLTRMSVGTAS